MHHVLEGPGFFPPVSKHRRCPLRNCRLIAEHVCVLFCGFHSVIHVAPLSACLLDQYVEGRRFGPQRTDRSQGEHSRGEGGEGRGAEGVIKFEGKERGERWRGRGCFCVVGGSVGGSVGAVGRWVGACVGALVRWCVGALVRWCVGALVVGGWWWWGGGRSVVVYAFKFVRPACQWKGALAVTHRPPQQDKNQGRNMWRVLPGESLFQNGPRDRTVGPSCPHSLFSGVHSLL